MQSKRRGAAVYSSWNMAEGLGPERSQEPRCLFLFTRKARDPDSTDTAWPPAWRGLKPEDAPRPLLRGLTATAAGGL